jgi:putative hydrolase of the HAD superfamily
MRIRTLVFDFGNVVGFFSHRRAAEQLAAFTGMAPEAIEAYLFGSRLEDEYESGQVSTAVFLGLVRETCRLHGTEEQLRAAFADMFWPNPEVCDLVPLLVPRYRLVLLSNTTELHAAQFRTQFAATFNHFADLVLSHEVGLRKPDPRIYAVCQQRAGCAATECLFIDDLPTNVAAARALGWQGIVYRPGEDLRRQLARYGVNVLP